MNKFDTACLLSALLANLTMNGLIYLKLDLMLDDIKRINRRLRAGAMLKKETHYDE